MTRIFPILETDYLIIRELSMDDLESINSVLNGSFGSNTLAEKREPWLQWTVLNYQMFAMLEQPQYGERGIALKDTGELIGAVGVVPYIDSFGQIAAFNVSHGDPAAAEVGLFWAIAPEYQGKGYATEAARIVADTLFNIYNLKRIIATTGYDNVASQAVMRKMGMIVEHAKKPQPPDIFVVGVLDNPSSRSGTNN